MKTLKNLFTSEDFSRGDNLVGTQYAADKAQLILDQFIKENGVKVYGWLARKGNTIWNSDQTCYDDNPTRQALIFDIEDIPEKQCEHKEAVYVEDQDKTWFKCIECGKPVKAKGWVGV